MTRRLDPCSTDRQFGAAPPSAVLAAQTVRDMGLLCFVRFVQANEASNLGGVCIVLHNCS